MRVTFYDLIDKDSEIKLNKSKLKIDLVDEDTFTAAKKFNKPCCLNFASNKYPGGGYKAGSLAQEENLFLRSNLPELMDTKEVLKYYPLKGVQGFFTSGVMVNKDKQFKDCDPYEVSLITLPALVSPDFSINGNKMSDDMKTTYEKVNRILLIAALNEQKDLILGAWGCGVFRNNPSVIAAMFLSALEKYVNIFDNVVFAIPGRDGVNYKAFESIISHYNLCSAS